MKHLKTYFFTGMFFISLNAFAMDMDEDTRQRILRECLQQSRASEHEYFYNADVKELNDGGYIEYIYDGVMKPCVENAVKEYNRKRNAAGNFVRFHRASVLGLC